MDTYVGTISKTIEEKFTMSHLLPKSLGESFLHAIKIDIHWLGLIQNSDDSIINKLDKIVQKFDLWTDTYLSSEFGSKLTDEHILCEKLQNLVDSIRLFILNISETNNKI